MIRTLMFFHNWSFLTLLLILAFTTACSSLSTGSGNNGGGGSTSSEAENGEHEDEHQHEGIDRIPNNGASIQINSPLDGATFAEGEEVVVEVQVDNFELGVAGNHWHIYVDGESMGMVTGGDVDQAMRGLEPGVFEISVYLTLSNHEELEDGDAVTITVKATE